MRAFSRAKIAPRAPTFVSAHLVARDVPLRARTARVRPRTHSSFRPATAASGAADADAAPPVPTVTRAACPLGETEVVVRYAYPGVRFSQGKAIVVRVRDDDAPRAADGTVAITGARVVEALADDGVDVARWRARVALDHPASASVLAHVDARDNPGATGSNDAAWRREPAYQSFVGWRRLEEDDVVGFPPRATGLLVQLEDGLVADTVMIKNPKYPRREPRKGGGRRGAKARARREAAESPDDEGFVDDEDLDRDPPRSFSGVASDYLALDDAARGQGERNNPYAGKRSSGTTVWPRDDAGAGYFGIGIVKPKHEANVGTLWRSAWQLGASFIFTVATRFKYEASDTTQAYKQLPLHKHEDWGGFAESSPHGAVWVAVEMGGTPLQDFEHPPRAVYVLGSEDNGLNRPVVEACQCHVALPKWVGRSSSYNVAMAGTLVMYDRMIKQLGAGHARIASDGGEE